jgi:D-methionine transport system substrate-binding protein
MSKTLKTVLSAASLSFIVAVAGFAAGAQAGTDGRTVVLGTLSGPHAEIAEVAAKIAEKKGLKVKIVEFSDYGHVNEALRAKDVDANAFQHVPYLNKAIKAKGYQFTPLGKTVLFPLGVYSQKIHSVKEIKEGMLVTIPADPANCGRGLQLLEREGVIGLKKTAGVLSTTNDIVDNPKHLKFREVDSAYLGRSLPDVGFAVINGSWAVKSGLVPAKDAFILEDGKSEYSNVLVVRTNEKDKPEFKILLESYQSPEVKDFVLKTYKGSVVPAF